MKTEQSNHTLTVRSACINVTCSHWASHITSS